MNKKKILLITIPIFLIILIAILLVVNNIMYYRTDDLDLLQQSGINTRDSLLVEDNYINGENFKYIEITSREKLYFGVKKYGFKAQCEYDDGDLRFAFSIYEVRYAKTQVKNFNNAIVGINHTIALKDLYVLIPNGNVDQLGKVFVDLGFKLSNCYYKYNENDNWAELQHIE